MSNQIDRNQMNNNQINVEGYSVRDLFASQAPPCPKWYEDKVIEAYGDRYVKPAPKDTAYYTQEEYDHLFKGGPLPKYKEPELIEKIKALAELARQRWGFEVLYEPSLKTSWSYYYADKMMWLRANPIT